MKRLWFKADVAGVAWSFYLADKADPDLGENEGVALSERAEVIIRGDLPNLRIAHVVLHEMVHVVFGECNEEFMSSMFGCAPKRSRQSEEALASFLGPMLAGLLMSAGALKLPSITRAKRSRSRS